MTPGNGAPPPNFPPPAPPPSMPPPAPGTGASGAGGPGPRSAPQSYDPTLLLPRDKSLTVGYVLLVLLGYFGVHHFYLGKIGRGIGYLLTLGWFMIGMLIDVFTLPEQVRRVNAQRRAGLR